MRMGSRMVVVANSFDSIRELWLKNRDANNSRPMLYTFHNVVSKTQGFTIGTTPYGDSFKRKKKVVSFSLNKQNIESNNEFIDIENKNMFRRINEISNDFILKIDEKDLDLFKLLQGFVLRVSLYLTYGYLVKVEHNSGCKLFDEISYVENRIVRLRGHSSNLQDYLPILRYLPILKSKTDLANELRKRRDVYMDKFINEFTNKFNNNNDFKNSITSKVFREELPKINDEELKSVCLTMVSAGLDNTPLVLNYIIGHLSQPTYGLKLQEIAFQHILSKYNSAEEAFENCIYGYHVPYIQALLKEGLRYFSVLPTSLPRQTTKDIIYHNAVIPKGTVMFMNTFAANHDEKYYPNPFEFLPERFLDENGALKTSIETSTMLSFGIGSRMCAGAHLAMKEMYITLLRMIILYEIRPPKNTNYLMELDPFKLNSVPDSVAFEPKVYKVLLKKRDEDLFTKMIPLN